jgi:transketolase
LAEANPWPAPKRAAVARPAEPVERTVNAGRPLMYQAGKSVDCRTAVGATLLGLAAANRGRPGAAPVVLDCDLLDSLRLRDFRREFPAQLIECGIQEHNAATVAAALSRLGVLTFFADFGVFAIDEVYGQHRMSDLNATSLKLVATHCGVDVGEDGKTHQCVDAVGLLANLWGFKVLAPADANQTDRMIRYAATTPGNVAILMGRSACPVLTDADGRTLFGEGYEFRYGQADWVRTGEQGTIVTFGHMVWRAARVSDALRRQGVRVGILNLACPVDLDTERLRQAAATGLLIAYEDHNERTGIGVHIGAFLAESGLHCRFRRMGLRQYGLSAAPERQYEILSLSEAALAQRVLSELGLPPDKEQQP